MNYLDFPNLSPEQRAANRTIAILEHSAQHAAELERLKREQIEREKSDVENERLAAWHLEQSRREREAEEEVKRKEAAAGFEADLRRNFFEGNSFASESDFRAMLPELRKRAMLENTSTADKAEETTKQQGNYVTM